MAYTFRTETGKIAKRKRVGHNETILYLMES